MKRTLSRTDVELHHYAPDGACVYGPHPALAGDCSGLRGDLDECELTPADRKAGVDIQKLVG